MPYVYQPTAEGRPRLGSEFMTPFSQVIEEARAGAYEASPILGSIPRWWQLHEDFKSGQTLPADQARAKIAAAGLEGKLTVSDGGITEAALATLIDRKNSELRRSEIMAGAAGGFWQGTGKLAAGLATFGADPINVGLAFMPVIGQARYLSWLANASRAGRIAIRAGTGALEGGVGMAAIEPFVYAMHRQEQADYGMQDSLENVLFGAFFGATLRGVGGTVAEGFRGFKGIEQPWERLRGLTPEEVTLAQNFRADFPSMSPKEAKGILDTWTPTARAAVSDLVPGEATFAETLDHAAAINATHAAQARALTPDTLQTSIRLAIGQAVDGKPVNVGPLLAGETARLPDGRMAADLAPERFTVDLEAKHAPELYQSVEQRLSALEAERASLPDEGRPEVYSRAVELNAQKTRLTAQQEAITALQQGRVLDPAQTEAVRQASVQRAMELGIPLPEGALAGISESASREARALRRAVTEKALQSEAVVPEADPAYLAADAAAKALPPEPKEDIAQFEADLATAETKAVTERLGAEPDAAYTEELAAIKNAERWAEVAEAATVCLVRGD